MTCLVDMDRYTEQQQPVESCIMYVSQVRSLKSEPAASNGNNESVKVSVGD